MLKKVLLFFLCFTAFHAVSQQVLPELKAVIKTLDYAKFQNYANHLSDEYSDDYYANTQWFVAQDIFYDYHESYVQIQERYLEDPFEEKYGRNIFDIKIISHCDTILFYEIVRQESHLDSLNKRIWTETIEATHTDIKQYKNFTSNYYEVFHAPFEKGQLFNANINTIYGFSCGLGGGLISFRKEMINFVQAKDTVAIMKWLSSAVPVLQLYAIDGILTLKSEGIQFDPFVYEIIKTITMKEGSVLACSGCEVMPYEIRFIAEAIMKRHHFTF